MIADDLHLLSTLRVPVRLWGMGHSQQPADQLLQCPNDTRKDDDLVITLQTSCDTSQLHQGKAMMLPQQRACGL